MFLLRLCLLLVFPTVFSEPFKPVPQDGIHKRAVNFDRPGSILKTLAKGIWSSITAGIMNIDDKTSVQNTHNIMRAPKENIIDFINCLRNTKEEFSQKVMKCFAGDNNLPKMQQSAIAALKLPNGGAGSNNIIEEFGVVYKCFAETSIKANDIQGSITPLSVCMVKKKLEKEMTNQVSQVGDAIKKHLPFPMSAATKSKTQLFDTYKRCLARRSKLSYEGKVLSCMKKNSNIFDKNLFKFIRVGSYKVDYLKGYNDKWGFKINLNSTINLDPQGANTDDTRRRFRN